MSYLKNIFFIIIYGALIQIPLLIFILFTHSYFTNYNIIPSIYVFYAEMKYGAIYLVINLYITGLAGKFFFKNV